MVLRLFSDNHTGTDKKYNCQFSLITYRYIQTDLSK